MAAITRRGTTWQARISFYDAQGKRHQQNKGGFKTKKAA